LRFLASRWLKVVISLGLFALLIRSTDLHGFLQQIAAARPQFLILAFLGYLLSQAFSAYKWRVLAQPLGFSPPWRTFIVYYFVGMYLNLFAPSTVVGDLGRGILLAQEKDRVADALHSVVADRLSGLVMLLWVSATGFLLFGPTVFPKEVGYVVIFAATLSVVMWWLLPQVVEWFFSPESKLKRLSEKLFLPYQQQPLVVGYACLLSFLFHWFQLSLQVLLAYALNLAVPVWYLVLFIPLVHLLSALPISFAGMGVRESGYVWFLALVGVAKNQALAFGLLWSALVLAAGMVGGLILLFSPVARFSLAQARKTTAESE